MKFEKFERQSLKHIAEPIISITRNNTIVFNSACVRTFIDDQKYVVLYYEKDEEIIGIQLSVDHQKYANSIARRRNNITIHAQAFFKYYNIQQDKTTKYHVTKDEETGMLLVDLKKKF